MSLWRKIRNVFQGEQLNDEIDEELQSHLNEAVEHGRDAGEARRAFGSPFRRREASRDARLVTWLDSLRSDTIFFANSERAKSRRLQRPCRSLWPSAPAWQLSA